MKNISLIAAMIGALLLSGCASNKDKDPYAGWSAPKIYATGHNNLKDGDNMDAIKAFVSLNSQYPFQQYAKKGDLELIYAYYESGDPALALAASARYIKLYPDDSKAAYAYYMAGVIEFNNGRGFLQRYFPYDMSEHNSKNYASAFKSFKTVLTDFPKSVYSNDARRRMIYLKNAQADYIVNIADFYMSKGAYVAAANRAKQVLVEYPRTTAVKPAMQVMIRSYHDLGFNALAQTAETVYRFNYGDDSFLKGMQPKHQKS